jgi:hypothetical protein
VNAEVKQQWLDALRSGEYEQTRGRLRRGMPLDPEDLDDGYNAGYCCLGVLCDLAVKAGVTQLHEERPFEGSDYENERNYVSYSYGVSESRKDSSVLPPEVVKWAGLGNAVDAVNPYVEPPTEAPSEKNGYEFTPRATLASENDGGKSFEEIAKIIEDVL